LSSSSDEYVVYTDHLGEYSQLDVPLVKIYLLDMVALSIVAVSRDITGVHLDGTSYPVAHTLIPFNCRVS
jgi:hypothetical protein